MISSGRLIAVDEDVIRLCARLPELRPSASDGHHSTRGFAMAVRNTRCTDRATDKAK